MSHPHYQKQTASLSNTARSVIINVDDLGLSTAVNDAVIHLAELGRIGASSYMVGGTITDSNINRLNQLNVDIGLHLDLTGIFPSALRGSLKSIIIASYLRHFNPMQVSDVIKQQLDGFEERFNRAPIFIDGHQHIHQFPVIREGLIKELTNRYSDEIAKDMLSARVTTPLINDVKSWIIYILGGYAWRKSCQHHQILTNDKFGGVYGFDADRQQLAMLWEKWLQSAPCHTANVLPTLIMCHPAIPDSGSDSWQDEIKGAREIEYEWLISEDFEELLAQYEVKLMRWSDITLTS
ncbi:MULTISPECIES: ChbG/HpnK family deacetylase [unclassified Psychrobacter]|uniref:ChbG/HpnK family deacetylase n=1 Tax=unclassified Psychrobacter TaxID=196806 RepID=UPI0025F4D1F5|nr:MULTISPECIES: ChbG/HpnK family deacetylase [unclassified Psychrobacter]